MTKKIQVSVVVPMYGSEESIVELVTKIRETIRSIYENEYELILVNDSSPDEVLNVVRNEVIQGDLVIVDLSKNYGQGNATLAGLEYAKGDIVVTIDDDLQFPPEEIPTLLKKLDAETDVVYGIPKKGNQSTFRMIGSRFINIVYRRLFKRNHDRSSFAAIRKPIVKSIIEHKGASHFLDGLILWYTSRIATVQVRKERRKHGKSGWNLGKLIRSGLDMVTNYSRSPLLMSAWVSFTASFAALLLGSFYIVMTLVEGRTIPGWASIFVSVSFFSSVQLFTLGMMGEYIARLQTSSNGKPRYSVRSVERFDND